MALGEIFLATCMLLSILALRFGIPCLCTWAISSILHYFNPHTEARPINPL